ncbi:hypothetical protein AB4Z45_27330 [Paenibacillus sp. MCAF9]|uniref:hypothetical protein n=1 Tax=Paenibacillus sp. MCAF9 TaxID=3233046 RepID=UPI003F96FFC0
MVAILENYVHSLGEDEEFQAVSAVSAKKRVLQKKTLTKIQIDRLCDLPRNGSESTPFDKSRYHAASALHFRNETVSMGRLALIDIQGNFAI